MITRGLGNNSLLTIGYVKKGKIIVFVKNNALKFSNVARHYAFKINERTINFLNVLREQTFSLSKYLTNKYVEFFVAARLNLFTPDDRGFKIVPIRTLKNTFVVKPQHNEFVINKQKITLLNDRAIKHNVVPTSKTKFKGSLR